MEKSAMRHARIHWQTPALLVSSLLVGISLAIGHHAFYQSINGTEASSKVLKLAGVKTSPQQLVSVGGTALAFLFKASLVLCASVAYVQLFFRTIQKHAQGFQLAKLDQWFAALEDVRSLLTAATYLRHPLLPLVAVTAWLLPIAAVISPAAISVNFDRIYPSSILSLHVPQPAFESLTFLNYKSALSLSGNATSLQAMGPSQEVSRIANAVAAGGTILPIEPPGSNTSWQVTIEAPKISCDNAKGQALQDIKDSVVEVVLRASGDVWVEETGPAVTRLMYTYLGWTGSTPFITGVDSTQLDDIQGQSQITADSTGSYPFGLAVFPRAINTSVLDDWKVDLSNYIAPPAWNGTENYTRNAHLLMDKYFEDATIILCEGRTANYTLQFSYTNREQNIDIVSMTEAPWNPNNLSTFYRVDVGVSESDELEIGLWEPKYGQGDLKHPDGVYNYPGWGHMALRERSFNALYQALLNMVVGGNIATATWLGKDSGGVNTQVFDTVLANTPEMLSITHQLQPLPEALINRTSGKAYDDAASLLYGSPEASATKPLKAALEELFFNITISTASSLALRYNESNPFVPEKVRVTFSNYGNVYVYDSEKLWIAYGIAIGISIINVICGLWAIFSTGAAFTANFSTVLRVAINSEIGTYSEEPVLPGKDPLPKRLGLATLRMSYGGQKEPLEH